MNPSLLPLFFCFTSESLLIVFYNFIVIDMIVFTLDIHYNPLKKDSDVMIPFQRLKIQWLCQLQKFPKCTSYTAFIPYRHVS